MSSVCKIVVGSIASNTCSGQNMPHSISPARVDSFSTTVDSRCARFQSLSVPSSWAVQKGWYLHSKVETQQTTAPKLNMVDTQQWQHCGNITVQWYIVSIQFS
jgi:hypothetical protein